MKLQLKKHLRGKIGDNIYSSVLYILLILFIMRFIELSGCATPKRVALPEQYVDSAEIPGMLGVRAWGDEQSDVFQEDLALSIREYINKKPPGEDGNFNILAISGGGPDGAFSAGFINGWDASDNRPSFQVVTGISSGALVAPFAFLGGKYDALIGELATSIETDNVFTIRSTLSILRGTDSVGDSSPLAHFIARYVDEDMLKHIAQAHSEGRRLYLGTTNLDAQRLVIWNMGAIASSQRPDAPELFRKIMRASASIPIIFQPMLIEVEANGKIYDEMHVDGGVAVEVFYYGDLMNVDEAYKSAGITQTPKEKLFILGTSQAQSHYEPVVRSLIDIGGKSITSLVKAQSIGDVYRIHATTSREGIDFNLASIPPEWEPNPQELFDPQDMKRLYDLGYNLAKSGYAWQKQPP